MILFFTQGGWCVGYRITSYTSICPISFSLATRRRHWKRHTTRTLEMREHWLPPQSHAFHILSHTFQFHRGGLLQRITTHHWCWLSTMLHEVHRTRYGVMYWQKLVTCAHHVYVVSCASRDQKKMLNVLYSSIFSRCSFSLFVSLTSYLVFHSFQNVPAIMKLGRPLLSRIKSLSANVLDPLEIAPLCTMQHITTWTSFISSPKWFIFELQLQCWVLMMIYWLVCCRCDSVAKLQNTFVQ